MTNWEEEADKAESKTDKELEKGLAKLMKANIPALFPNPADAEKIKGLIADIKANTAYNDRIAAIKAVSLVITADATAALKKILLVLLVALMAGVGSAMAQESGNKPMLDFSSFFLKSRIGMAVNQHMNTSTVIYSAFKRYNVKPGMELLNWNIGYQTDGKHPVVMMGARADNLDKLIWSGKWADEHIETAAIPAIEFGPYISTWPVKDGSKIRLPVEWGVILAVGFK